MCATSTMAYKHHNDHLSKYLDSHKRSRYFLKLLVLIYLLLVVDGLCKHQLFSCRYLQVSILILILT